MIMVAVGFIVLRLCERYGVLECLYISCNFFYSEFQVHTHMVKSPLVALTFRTYLLSTQRLLRSLDDIHYMK